MANVTTRELTRTVGETDASGQTTRDEKVYEYGFEVKGVFVRIGTVTEGQIADARIRADVERERSNESTPASDTRTTEPAE